MRRTDISYATFETANLSRLERQIKLPMSTQTFTAIGRAAKEMDMGNQEFIMFCVRREIERLIDEDESPQPFRGRHRRAA